MLLFCFIPDQAKGDEKEVINMNEIDLSLNNADLYKDCVIEEIGGRQTLTTPVAEATNIVGRNAGEIVDNIDDRSEITLTGPMAVWAYLLVFHQVVHRFSKVYYDDGRTGSVLISQH